MHRGPNGEPIIWASNPVPPSTPCRGPQAGVDLEPNAPSAPPQSCWGSIDHRGRHHRQLASLGELRHPTLPGSRGKHELRGRATDSHHARSLVCSSDSNKRCATQVQHARLERSPHTKLASTPLHTPRRGRLRRQAASRGNAKC